MNPTLESRYKNLYTKTIAKNEFDETIIEIGERTNEVWKYICAASKRKINWWAFSNDVELGNGNGSTGGSFDPVKDKEWITIIGEFKRFYDGIYPYDDGFPTELLWDMNWEHTIDNEVLKAKKLQAAEATKKAADKAKQATRRALIISGIRTKLTKEELKYINFK